VQRGGLTAEPPPVSPADVPTALAWNGSRDRDPGERWFRGEVMGAIMELIARSKKG
jgi:hypothetical protein